MCLSACPIDLIDRLSPKISVFPSKVNVADVLDEFFSSFMCPESYSFSQKSTARCYIS